MSAPYHIAITFLAFKSKDFIFTVYRKKLEKDQESLPGTRYLPTDCLAASPSKNNNLRYVISLSPQDGYEQVAVRAWVNPELTLDVLHQSLRNRATADDLLTHTEFSEKKFNRKIDFVLRRHGDAREVMWLRPYNLHAVGKFGFLCGFALRVPVNSDLPVKKRLELSLTHKNGRINADFFLDQHQKIGEFLHTYLEAIQKLKLHDGSELELESKLSVIPCFTLSPRTYVFGSKREGKNQFFGLRDYSPLQPSQPNTRLVFVFQASDRPKSQDLFRALRGDTYSTFSGMEKMFRTPISKDNVAGIEVSGFGNDELIKTCSILKYKYPNERILPIAVVPFSKHVSDQETSRYYEAKYSFLSNGLASQFIDRNRLDDRNALKWSISNIGLAVFAKMGGVPWRVVTSTDKCLIVGIGQAHRIVDDKIEKYVAYSVLTDSSGIYESIKVLGCSTNQQEYLNNLKSNLKQVLISHKNDYKSFVLHVTFRMKRDEIKAIHTLLDELKGEDTAGHEFVAIKFNDYNDFFGFSVDHNSRVPYEGTVVPLSKKDFLMWFSGIGIADAKAPKQPERPVHLHILYPDEPLNEVDLRRLLQDAMNIAGANWRGFNAKSMPISVYYAKLIAEYYAHFRQANLPDVDMDNLPPWFL